MNSPKILLLVIFMATFYFCPARPSFFLFSSSSSFFTQITCLEIHSSHPGRHPPSFTTTSSVVGGLPGGSANQPRPRPLSPHGLGEVERGVESSVASPEFPLKGLLAMRCGRRGRSGPRPNVFPTSCRVFEFPSATTLAPAVFSRKCSSELFPLKTGQFFISKRRAKTMLPLLLAPPFTAFFWNWNSGRNQISLRL